MCGVGRALRASDDLIARLLKGVDVARDRGFGQSAQLRLDSLEVVTDLEYLQSEDASQDDGPDQDQTERAQRDPERPPPSASTG